MPRININEKDFTSPGASLDYANFAVLLAGFEGANPTGSDKVHLLSGRLAEYREEEVENERENTVTRVTVYNRPVSPDDNGVYEFTSPEDFKETIGLCSPRRELAGGDKVMYHYGNQMAYELLKLGYTVIYLPITSASDLTKESTWEIFKDKSSYDFRFISHGLLTSDPIMAEFLKDSDVLAKDALVALADSVLAKCTPEYKRSLYITETREDPTDPAKTIEVEVLLNSSELTKNKMLLRCSKMKSLNDVINSFEGKLYCETKKVGKDGKVEYTTEKVTPAQLADIISARFHAMLVSDSGEYNDNLANFVASETIKAEEAGKDFEISFENCWNVLGDFIMKQKAGIEACITSDIIGEANTCIANLAAYRADEGSSDEPAINSGRGDCVALIELDEYLYTTKTPGKKPEQLILDGINSSAMGSIDATNGAYCALTVPSIYYKSLSTDIHNIWDGNNKLPGSFHYLACFKNSLNMGYKEWYAAAGYTRGVSSLVVDHASVKLGEIAINLLEPRNYVDANHPKFACNVIANFRGSYYLWGNRTAHPIGKKGNLKNGDLVASSFLNIRHLCTSIKKQLYTACRQFTFDPNSDTLWINFCAAIKPTLEAMKADQGVRDYKIIKVHTDKKATLKAKIRIIPIEAVEDFTLEVSLEDSFGETTATVTE